ncbi:MAG: exo-alpha-sialidase [Bryobacterales bacterium]|nr:exo-alpha-sialidase [Bryobacterales bacterium]
MLRRAFLATPLATPLAAPAAPRQIIVDREPGQYLGHPTTVLLKDGKTILCVYPKGHGKGPIQYKRSTDGGLTWSERLPTPKNWETSLETPTIHLLDKDRLILFSGLYPIRSSISDDNGATWTPLAPIGDFGGIVAMSSLLRLKNGDFMAVFHDDGRFFQKTVAEKRAFIVYKTVSRDNGQTWSQPSPIAQHAEAHLCEPGLIRSPNGKQIAMLLRENSRKFNSFVMFSDNEGQSWSTPREVPPDLTGDRHVGIYTKSKKLFITFRDVKQGAWVAWLGSYDDIAKNRPGERRMLLMKNHKGADCAYPGLERLPDGTLVTTTYGHWTPNEQPYIVSLRIPPNEL